MFTRMLVTSVLASVLGLAQPAAALDEARKVESHAPKAKLSYQVKSSFQLGGPDAPETSQFYERFGATEVTADGAGNLYVLDNGNHRVQVFDPSGRHLRSIGGEGEGPGEFKMPARLSVTNDGTCAVFDMANQRVSIFDPEGKLLRDQILTGVARDLAFDRSGNLIIAQTTPGGESIAAYDAKGAELWAIRPPAEPRGGRQMMIEVDGETMGSRLAVAPDGSVLRASADAYLIKRIRDGEVSETYSRAFTRQAKEALPRMTGGEGEGEEGGNQMVVVIRREGGEGGGDTQVSEGGPGQWSNGEHEVTLTPEDIAAMMPKFRPDIRTLLAWPDGRLWVLTAEDEGGNIVADEWKDGEYHARFLVPSEYQRFSIGADGRLYAVAHDREDYPIVHRLEIQPGN